MFIGLNISLDAGLQFIESNFASVTDEKQCTPIGFDIIFPGMIEYAKDLNLNLPLRTADVDKMLQRKYSELRRHVITGNCCVFCIRNYA